MRIKNGTMGVDMETEKPLQVKFFRQDSGREPVREWLKDLPPEERKVIGEDIKTVQWGWPIGMPLVRPLGEGLFEVRSKLTNRIARVIFLHTWRADHPPTWLHQENSGNSC
jgi:phage-related protein